MLEGNEGGFRRFHDIYGWRLFRLAATLLGGDLESAEDIVQETMVRIVRHIKSFDCETAFWNCWRRLFAIWFWTKNAPAFDSNNSCKDGDLAGIATRSKPGVENPKEAEIHLLEIALMQLDPPNALHLRRKYQEGLSFEGPCPNRGLTVEAMESRLARPGRN